MHAVRALLRLALALAHGGCMLRDSGSAGALLCGSACWSVCSAALIQPKPCCCTSLLLLLLLQSRPSPVGTGLVGAPACGDVMKLQIRVDEDGNIVDSCFKTFGCGSAIASSSVATEWVKGKSLQEVTTIKNSDIAKHLSLPPVKLHCSMLAEDAIKAAVKDIKAKRAAAAAGDAGAERVAEA
jgi:Fe-S cluster assembly scaffold IscU